MPDEKPTKDTLVKVTLRLPAPLVKRAKHYAVDADCDLQDVVREALLAHLAAAKRGR
jgi:hypothetical protein